MTHYTTLLKILVPFMAALFVACGAGQEEQSAPAGDYSEQAAMSIFMQAPERALTIIDSAIITGTLQKERAGYLRAIVYSSSLHDNSTAKHIVHHLLESPAVQADEQQTERLYALLASMAHSEGNDRGVMHYAPKAYQLAEKNGWLDEMGQMSSYIATAMAHKGQTEEAVETLQVTLSRLEAQQTFGAMVTYVSVAKSMTHLLYDTDQKAGIQQVCQNALARLDYFEQHTDHFAGLPEGYTPDEFVDMSRGQLYAILCIAEAEAGRRAEALKAESLALSTRYGKSGRTDKTLITAWLAMGEWQKFDSALDRIDRERGGDTLTQNYLVSLQNRSAAAEKRGRMQEALQYQRRAFAIQDSLNKSRIHHQLAEQATVYHLQEAAMAQKHAESRSHTLALLLQAIVLGIVIIIAFAVYFFITRRDIKQKNKVQAKMIDDYRLRDANVPAVQAAEQASLAADADVARPVSAGEEQYQALRRLIVDNRLYADITLGRDKAASMMGISRHSLNALLNAHTDCQSFPQWIGEIRCTEACRLLHDHPDLSVNDIAAQVGLSPNNLRRLFRQYYGISPSEYRKSRGEEEAGG